MIFNHIWHGLSPHLGSDSNLYFAFSILHFLFHAFNSSLHNPACFLSGSVKVGQTCPIPCDPMGYTVHGILQSKILEWVAFPFSRGSSQPRDRTQVSHIGGRFFTSWATRESPYNPEILLWLCKQKDRKQIQIDTCTPMFIAALFTVTKRQKQYKCPLMNEEINKMWCIYTVEY